ncbi:MAG: 4Fe-4S dicluster domain-containing protein [Planctomycetes bacterium]|jgi:NADH:ubiquinone oxidoreductase subunit F (NADH-binding)/NADH:ubiquinone oxidoreductase subunit E|nr:4Fe-4S dicluster domain-containing protein [Planctomycetota bacterium]
MTDETLIKRVDAIVDRIGRDGSLTIPLLQAIQREFRYLPVEALDRLCETTDITPAQVAGVSTFYDQFRHTPAGEHRLCVCVGTACHVKGANQVIDAFKRYLGIAPDGDTDPQGRFTIQRVACLGCCTLAPVVQIEENIYGHVHAANVSHVVEDFLAHAHVTTHHHRGHWRQRELAGEIRLGLGSCCQARGSAKVREAVLDAIAASGRNVRLKPVGCVGICSQTPLLEIVEPGDRNTVYMQVQPQQAREIVLRHFRPQGVVRRIVTAASTIVEKLLTDEAWADVDHHATGEREQQLDEFLGPQKHICTERCGELSPTSLAEYEAGGGFEALRRCVAELQPEAVIETIQRSGLRGRGGAGYPTGAKWRHVCEASGDGTYVVCNGDEGDPGAFMDRMLLESYPFRVLEGLAIAARAVGASEGILYIRQEYPLAVKRVREAIEAMEDAGLLGDDVLSSGWSLRLSIMEGAGAFVCGEETALLASIMGRRGMPRLRPPYPSQSGLWGKPTLVNNVETLSNVAWIIRHGADAFARIGTQRSSGTKVFALAGKIRRGGLIEVPMGVTIRQIVDDIGGGVQGGRQLKAVQIGGPSGGCVPARLAETPVDYEHLREVGAIMGSGGLVVLDETDCMVDIARYFLQFTQDQSCGKCTFCRIGTRRMLELLDDLCEGRGTDATLATLETLLRSVPRGSLCGLGKTAPNPVVSTLRYFRDEYEAHVAGACPAGKCAALVRYKITDDCIGCTKCAQQCPVDAIEPRPHRRHEVDNETCVRCGACRDVCPVDAVTIESGSNR